MKPSTCLAIMLATVLSMAGPACDRHAVDGHGHSHGGGHGHGDSHGHGHGDDHAHAGTHSHEHDHGHAHRPDVTATSYTDKTELFVRYPALIAGEKSAFAVHLTRSDDFEPVVEGKIVVTITSEGGGSRSFETDDLVESGLFRPVVRPSSTGSYRLRIRLEHAGVSDVHELGTVTVYEDEDAAARDVGQAEDDEHAGHGHGTDPADVITFPKEQQWQSDFGISTVSEHTLRASLRANGVLRPRRDGEAHVTATASGRMLTAGDDFPYIGMEVVRDQVLAEIAPALGRDTDLATLELAVSQARITLSHADRELRRLRDLLEQGAVPAKRGVEAEHDRRAAKAAVDAAEQRLAQYHGTQRASGGEASGRISVRAPITGTIVQVSATPGSFLDEGEQLFYVVALDRLWLEVQIPEADIGRVRETAGAWFEVDGFDERFEVDPGRGGRVVSFGGVVDPQRRTVPLLFELPNPGRKLRVGMFATTRVLTGVAQSGTAVPVTSVVDEGGRDVVYVQTAGETFERRIVRLGIRDGNRIGVLEGVVPGERVVSEGAYLVRLASASNALPDHGHPH